MARKYLQLAIIIQGLPIQDFEEGDLLFLGRDTGESNDFFVYNNLDHRDQGNQVHMSQRQNCKIPR